MPTTESEIVKSHFSRRVDKIWELEKAMEAAVLAFTSEMEEMQYIFKKHPNLLDEQAKQSMKYLIKTRDVRRKIEEFALEGEKIPFFSEAKLYDLVGKGDARIILGFVEKLLQLAGK